MWWRVEVEEVGVEVVGLVVVSSVVRMRNGGNGVLRFDFEGAGFELWH